MTNDILNEYKHNQEVKERNLDGLQARISINISRWRMLRLSPWLTLCRDAHKSLPRNMA